MQNNYFADSNIWLYGFMESTSPKKQIASDLILNENVVLSTQVVNEICVNLIKKSKYTHEDVLNFLLNLDKKYIIHELFYNTLIKAAELRIKYNVSFWDSIIISSALENKCSILYTEDMQHNQIIENSLAIINPFK